jgi:hypothetical protein
VYSTCLFCQASLGKNDAIEHFPIGRRLAYDAAKGRLWVVCRKCARWNLTPLEERWEAIEECERAFSSTKMRVSTDNVGLARLSEGLELVRIGAPQRPEFAAWRYGDQFGRRRRRYLVYTGLVGAGAMGKFIAGPVLGLSLGATVGSVVSVAYAAAMGASLFQQTRIRGRIAVPGEKRPAIVRQGQLKKIRILNQGDRWHLRMPVDGATISGPDYKKEVTVEGDAAQRAAATILAVCNEKGANAERLREATDIVGREADPSRLFVDAARRHPEIRITDIPGPMLLALEMATNEDIERRAMEGELAMLEAAWKQAEEIAAIADNLELRKPDDISARSIR